MPRRKKPTYNDYARQIESLQAKMAERRERMVQILSSVLDDKAAAALGDLSDAELRKVMELFVEDISVYVDRVTANRRPRPTPKAKLDSIPEAPESAEKPAQTAANIPTVKSVNPSAQAAVKAPAGTQPVTAPKAATQPVQAMAKPPVNAQSAPAPKPTVQPGQAASDAPDDKPIMEMPNYPLVNGKMRFNDKEQKWGVWDKDADDWYIPRAPLGITLEVCTNNKWYRGTLAIRNARFGEGECFSTTLASGELSYITFSAVECVRSIQST